jgi:predicted secreted protein
MQAGTETASAVVTRRGFLTLAAAAAAVVARTSSSPAQERSALADAHRPLLRLPAATTNGARVPIVVDVPHPMEPRHHVTVLRVVNPRDPVPLKGTFHFTPASGRAYVAFQARVDDGPSTVEAAAECGRHGPFRATATVRVAEGGGGCAATAPAVLPADEIRAPVLRIPQIVGDGRISAGDLIDVQIKVKHPNRTGLALRDGRWIQASEAFHLAEAQVFHGSEPVSRFVLTAALSDNPFITFKLRAVREAPVRVILTNTRGQRFEASHPIHFD